MTFNFPYVDFSSIVAGLKCIYILHQLSLQNSYYSGVFSTGATGAIAPVILRRKLIAPVILPGMYPPQ